MADFVALGEIQNLERPARRAEKTYGKKKGLVAQSRAMHFDLFGGRDENKVEVEKKELTVSLDRPKSRQEPDQEHSPPAPKLSAEHNPRRRGRRKAGASKKMAKLTPEKLQALAPLLSLVQREVQDFQEFGRSIGKRYICTKLGEGAYADVFRLEPKDLEEARDVAARGGLVIKVIPFIIDEVDMVDELVDLNSITREIQVLQTMDQEHGFARCRGVNVVHGKYPDVFLDAFHMFQTADPEEAINEDPTKNIPPDQMYVILEMDDTGMPLSKLKWPSAFQVFDIFWKTTMILAHAEQKVEFEHRDLHNGNVCFKPLKMDGPIDVTQEVVENMEEEPEVILGLSNLKVTVIDYTLARAKCANPDPDSKGGDLVVFDPITFWEKNDSVGDSEADKRQYDTYRKVRDWAKKKDEQARALAELEGVEYEGPQDKYARFLPKSNVLWLGYLLADLLVGCSPQGRGACLPGSSRAAKKLQVRLWRSLEHVNRLINGASPTLIPESAEDLLASAVDTGLLSPADTAAFREQMEE